MGECHAVVDLLYNKSITNRSNEVWAYAIKMLTYLRRIRANLMVCGRVQHNNPEGERVVTGESVRVLGQV